MASISSRERFASDATYISFDEVVGASSINNGNTHTDDDTPWQTVPLASRTSSDGLDPNTENGANGSMKTTLLSDAKHDKNATELLYRKDGGFLGRPQRSRSRRLLHPFGEDDYFSRVYIVFWGSQMVTFCFLLYTAPDTVDGEINLPDNPWLQAFHYLAIAIVLGLVYVEILRLNRPTTGFFGKCTSLRFIILVNISGFRSLIYSITHEVDTHYGVQRAVLNAWRFFQLIVADYYSIKLLFQYHYLGWLKKGLKYTPVAQYLRGRQRKAIRYDTIFN